MTTSETPLQRFKGRKLIIATMHGKERVIAPLLQEHLGVQIVVPTHFDTDTFGTFTRDIRRAGNQLEAARAKAYAAMEQENVDLAVSSEGSFGPHPSVPFIQSNLELLLLIDKKNGYEIRGHHRTQETNIDGKYITDVTEALEYAHQIGFPEHGIIVRKTEKGNSDINKNIQTEEDLATRVSELLSGLFTNRVFLETDMRAHRNPTRMKAIEEATKDLIQNIFSICPKCQTPGFVAVDFEKGLRCTLCNLPTDLPINDIYQCGACNHSEKRKVTQYGTSADPSHCKYCNP